MGRIFPNCPISNNVNDPSVFFQTVPLSNQAQNVKPCKSVRKIKLSTYYTHTTIWFYVYDHQLTFGVWFTMHFNFVLEGWPVKIKKEARKNIWGGGQKKPGSLCENRRGTGRVEL